MIASSTYYKTLEDLEVKWREVELRDLNDASFYIRKIPANYNNNNDCANRASDRMRDWKYAVRFAQIVNNLDIWLRTTNHKNSRLKGKEKSKIIYLLLHIVTLGWVNEKPHEALGRTASDRVAIYAFARWLVSSQHGLGQFR